MSVQFGRCSFGSEPAAPDHLEKVRRVLARYGPDGGSFYSRGSASILYHAFHTTKESRRETQPHVLASGAVLTWDGRLDNREDLIHQLTGKVSSEFADASIVAAAHERWGTGCLAKLLGDWALSIWNPDDRSLILAKDFAGSRPLYYRADKDQIVWSSILEPLVLFAGRPFSLNR